MIKGVAFDMDGTLTKPKIDFAGLRKKLGLVDESRPLFELIMELDEPERSKALSALEQAEIMAGENAEANPGLYELIDFLEAEGIKRAIFTRSSTKALKLTLSRLRLEDKFQPLITRDLGLPLKPNPAPILHILEVWKLTPQQILVVGDYVLDLQCGKNAGARTVYLNHNPGQPAPKEADFVIHRLDELVEIIKKI